MNLDGITQTIRVSFGFVCSIDTICHSQGTLKYHQRFLGVKCRIIRRNYICYGSHRTSPLLAIKKNIMECPRHSGDSVLSVYTVDFAVLFSFQKSSACLSSLLQLWHADTLVGFLHPASINGLYSRWCLMKDPYHPRSPLHWKVSRRMHHPCIQ